jgi:hypothetical protein
METHFPQQLPENRIQMGFIAEMAVKMGVPADQVAPHWVELFSPPFREAWQEGIRDTDTLRERIYKPDPLGSNYADMVASILIGQPDPRLTP